MTKKDKEVEQLKHQLARALADYQNLQKRVTKESQDIVRRQNKAVLARLLPVLYVLEKVTAYVKDEGVVLAVSQFKDALSDFGVKEIRVLPGDKFDARIHEAVDVVPGKPKGIIAEVTQKGFVWNDGEILRPAQVKVYGKTEKKEKLKTEMLRGDYV